MSRALTRLAGVLVLGLAACGTSPASTAGPTDTADGERVRPELHCTERPAGGGEACQAQGCAWQPALHCMGIPPPPEMEEEWHRAWESSSATCTCVCPVDVERCSMVP